MIIINNLIFVDHPQLIVSILGILGTHRKETPVCHSGIWRRSEGSEAKHRGWVGLHHSLRCNSIMVQWGAGGGCHLQREQQPGYGGSSEAGMV